MTSYCDCEHGFLFCVQLLSPFELASSLCVESECVCVVLNKFEPDMILLRALTRQ